MSESQNILPRRIETEMRESYIDYAMSVIVSRALPDVRDGLKPVHRRILYAMNELNLDPGKAHKKSARIVGDTMGKYHPHGETSIYDAMVRMAQEFSMRYPLVDGHGNFGSMDGDSAAAQRYTEARLSKISVQMLADIEKNTVDFAPNYDEEFLEPTVLPSRFPNLLVNGSSGIAVGMATNIPPHNLTEVIDGVIKVIDNYVLEERETEIKELVNIIKGPDFPTGASILGLSGIKQAYKTGKGKIIIRAKSEILPFHSNREQIVFTELPYQVNKAKLLEKIGELVADKRVEGISDVRDESNRDGVRLVVELKKDANSKVVLNRLYKDSPLQESFGIIMLALVNNKPEILNIKEMLEHYLNHQIDVITRRTDFELEKAQKRSHILEGLIIAQENIDEIIKLIRNSKDINNAKEILIEKFSISQAQATAIVEMRLRNLTGLEKDKLTNEFNELKQLIEKLSSILGDKRVLYNVIREELLIIKEKYGDERKTMLLHDPGEIIIEDLIDEEQSVITFSYMDYVKRIPLSTYRSQNRGGRGVVGMQTRDEDIVKDLFIASTHDYILYFTSKGRVYRTKAYEIPEAGRTARGMAIINMLNLEEGEKIAAIMPIREFPENKYIMLVTKKGLAKKVSLDKFSKINKRGLYIIKFKEEDELISAMITDGNCEVFIATSFGFGLRISETEIRATGRTSMGVRCIRLRNNNYIVGADVLEEDSKLLFVSEKGFGKCTEINSFRVRHRGGVGIKMYKITERTGNVIGVSKVKEKDELMIINSEGIIIRLRVEDISTKGRVTQGVKLINLAEDSKVISIAKIAEEQIKMSEEESEDEETI